MAHSSYTSTSESEWVEEHATVIDVSGDEATVDPAGKLSCKSCSSQQGCSSNAFSFFTLKSNKSALVVKNSVGAKVGDGVIIGVPSGALLISTLLVYGMPLVTMLLFALSGQLLSGAFFSGNEMLTIVLAGFGLLTGFYLAKTITGKLTSQRRFQPVVRRISQSSEHPLVFARGY